MEAKKNGVYPVFLAFLCMGFGDVVGPMVSLAKDSFGLSNFMAAIVSLFRFSDVWYFVSAHGYFSGPPR